MATLRITVLGDSNTKSSFLPCRIMLMPKFDTYTSNDIEGIKNNNRFATLIIGMIGVQGHPQCILYCVE